MITGKDLIALGYIPNKLFGDAIKYINTYELSTEEIKSFLDEFFKPTPTLEPFKTPVDYILNIKIPQIP